MAPAMSGVSPAEATVDAAPPEPPTSVPEPPGDVPRFEVDGDTVWRDVLAVFTPDERSCIRDALGGELLESVMDRPAVFLGYGTEWQDSIEWEDSTEWERAIFGCLAEETARELLISLVAWNLESGLGVERIDVDEACLRDLIADVGIAALLAEEDQDGEPDTSDEVWLGMLTCTPELLVMVFLAPSELFGGSGPALDDDQRACVREVAADADWASLADGSEFELYDALVGIVRDLSECVPELSSSMDDSWFDTPAVPSADVADDYGDAAGESARAVVGEAVLGSVDYRHDVDFFVFEAEAGEVYRIDVSLGTLSDSVVVLYDADGSELGSNDDIHDSGSLASRLHWKAESSGLLHVAVRGYEDEAGSYTLTIDNVADDYGDAAGESARAVVGEAVLGSVDYQHDVDFFVFEAEAGEVYRIDVSLGTLSDSVVVLYGADGSELGANDDVSDVSGSLASRLYWKAESSGLLYVAVKGYDYETGSYTLTIEGGVDIEEADAYDKAAGDSESDADWYSEMDC